MARSQCVRSLLEDAFGQLEPCVGTATSGEDGEDEDAQIAAVVAKLAEDSFQLEAVHKNLRDKQLDSKTLCAAGLVADIEAEKQEEPHELQKAGYPSEQPVVRRGPGQETGGKIKAARPAPLQLIPEAAVFQGCRVGQTYDVKIEIRNVSAPPGTLIYDFVEALLRSGFVSILLLWRKRSAAAEEREIAALFRQLQDLSKAVCMVVSDARSTSFSQRNLAKYLTQRGLEPSGQLLQDAKVLVSVLRDDALQKANSGAERGRAFAHELKKSAVDRQRLVNLFPDIKASYVQQPLDYGRNSRYGDQWRISCYLVVMENWKPKILPHEPMLRCLGSVMSDCVDMFEDWYCQLKGYRLGSKKFEVMNAFVTRYRPVHGEDELQKHIDGANVDGSVILALPTDEPFEGGALHVWDGKPKQELVYTMDAGDCIFLDTKIWPRRNHSLSDDTSVAAVEKLGEELWADRRDEVSSSYASRRRQVWATRRRGRSSVAMPSPVPETCRAPLLIVGMTSLPSRLEGIGPALESIASQSRRPDRLVLSLPRLSAREGRKYELPDHVTCLMAKHPWMEVNWLEEDAGPGTKLLGAADWFQRSIGRAIPGDMLMLLDDDHAYLPSALGELCQIQQHLGCDYISSFFAYFFRGLMVPQGADIVALQLDSTTLRCIIDFHRCFVKGDAACFLVDDLWTAMFYFLSGRQVRSFRDRVIQRGLETIYSRTDNASVAALMDLDGSARRDRAMVSAFEGLLQRLLDEESQLSSIAGEDAVQRLHKLAAEVRQADRRIVELNRWLLQAQLGGTCESQLLRRATQELAQLMHLYLMQKLPEKPPSTSDADILAEEVNAAVPKEKNVSSRAVKARHIRVCLCRDRRGVLRFRHMAKRKIENAPNPDSAQTIRGLDLPTYDGAGLRIGILSARWNSIVCDSLVAGAVEALTSCNVTDITIEHVAGSYEIPQAAQVLLDSGRFDGIICIGCLIKGGTMHFEYISEAVTQGIMRLNLDYKAPVIYGILGCLNEEQAKERAGVNGAGHNSGKDWGITVVESCLLTKKYKKVLGS
ncbi:rib4 [Symbiodinium sp. CCMP2456]|nr:rib4 [Symbiodinium sp. CCMP2456]